MAKLKLEAPKRDVFGRKVKSLRKQGILPANIYGKNIKSTAVQVDTQDFEKILEKAGETSIVNLKVGKESKKRPVLISNLQRDPITDFPIHVDFHQVDLTQKVTVDVPIEIKGVSVAVEEKGAVLIRLLDELEVEALPDDLPEKILVDISPLKEFDQSVLVKDLKVGDKVNILADPKEAVVMVQEPKEEEMEAPPAEAEVEEAEAEAEVEAEEGEAPEEEKEKEAQTQKKQDKKSQDREEKKKQ